MALDLNLSLLCLNKVIQSTEFYWLVGHKEWQISCMLMTAHALLYMVIKLVSCIMNLDLLTTTSFIVQRESSNFTVVPRMMSIYDVRDTCIAVLDYCTGKE